MGRTRAAHKPKPVVVSPSLYDTGRRSVRLRQQKLHEVKNGARFQKKVRGRNGSGEIEKASDKVEKSPVGTLTIDLTTEDAAASKSRSSKAPKAQAGVTPKLDKLTDAEKEEILKQFDLDQNYGPCCGISRSERLRRAQRFETPVDEKVVYLLDSLKGDIKSKFEICLWDRSTIGST